MKTYFPDDPVKQEMLKTLIYHLQCGQSCGLLDVCYRKKFECQFKKNCRFIKTARTIEKATNKKIKEVLNEN